MRRLGWVLKREIGGKFKIGIDFLLLFIIGNKNI